MNGKTNTDGTKDYGSVSVTFLADGSIEVRLTSESKYGNLEGGLGTEKNPIPGKIDSSGRVSIDRKEHDGEAQLHWEGQFSVASGAGGNKATGGGTFDGKAVMMDGDVITTCHGAFKLK